MSKTETYLINEKETKEGYRRILKIIHRLLSDSELCKKQGRFATSVALSILTLEENAKADFFRRKTNDGLGVTKKEWEKLTRNKGKSHNFKLHWHLDNKEKSIEKWNQNDINALNAVNARLGLYKNSTGKKELESEIVLFKKIIPKFNAIKQSCFYTTWSKDEKWKYFDNIFSDKLKVLIADFFFFEAKKQYLYLILRKKTPKKQFRHFSKDDWKTMIDAKELQEVKKINKQISKTVSKQFDLIIQAIMSIPV